ncbi:MAG: aldehyde dehydrogenase family protein [Oscillospiraceae bacterium]
MKAYDKQYIAGEWREGRGTRVLENRNPYSGELLYSYRSASREDVDDAYTAAAAAQKLWEAVPLTEKADTMERLLGVIREYGPVIDECLLKEQGAILPKRMYEVGDSALFARYFMSFPYQMEGKIQPSAAPGQENFVYRKPKGVITVIAPWNVPFILALRSVLPAIATGNAVVLKPASDTPASAFIIAEMFEKAGFPKGLLNVVAGSGGEIGDYIVEHPLSAMVSFTGSTEVGQRIGGKAGAEIKEVSLELGGNNTMILLPDADLERAAELAIKGAYFNQGQVCMGLNRIVAVGDTYEKFWPLLAEKVRSLKVGDPADPEVFIGPIINAVQVKHCDDLIQATLERGATALVEGHTEGNVIFPWLLGDVTNDMPAARNEMFGPVCSLLHARDEDEAVAIANDTKYGLSNSVFGRDVYHAMKVARRLESGMVHINDQSIGDEPHVMFGAEKKSGVGRFNGEWVLKKFTTEQWLAVNES